jgi:hypothetical protein
MVTPGNPKPFTAHTDTNFGPTPISVRPDFQAMLADLAFPAQPFSIDAEGDH